MFFRKALVGFFPPGLQVLVFPCPFSFAFSPSLRRLARKPLAPGKKVLSPCHPPFSGDHPFVTSPPQSRLLYAHTGIPSTLVVSPLPGTPFSVSPRFPKRPLAQPMIPPKTLVLFFPISLTAQIPLPPAPVRRYRSASSSVFSWLPAPTGFCVFPTWLRLTKSGPARSLIPSLVPKGCSERRTPSFPPRLLTGPRVLSPLSSRRAGSQYWPCNPRGSPLPWLSP